MENLFLWILVAFIYCSLFCSATVEVVRPRGVSLAKKIFYTPAQDFNCIDGSYVIPYKFVNDDFCDCEDGSDEPGTSACSNSFFHCINSGYVSMNVPSSRVNDDICDCCDGSDEYNSTIQCPDTCSELGQRAREELQKQQQLFETGYGLWKQYAADGKRTKESSKAQLEELRQSEAELEKKRTEKEAMKNEIEQEEKAVLELYTNSKEDEEDGAEEAFRELDSDSSGVLTIEEVRQFAKFDSDQDGQVSEEEAKFYLQNKDSMDFEEFRGAAWMLIKPVYMLNKVEVSQQEEEVISEAGSDNSNEEEEDLSEDEDLPRPPPTEEQAKPQYDPETQRIVDAATEARKDFQSAVDELERLRDEIKQVQAFLDADMGRADEFSVLKGQCFELEDREYTYRLCPFDRASQVAKSGGADVNLGRWGTWIGPEDNKYSKMRYENGQTCWNGPARSVTVLLQCGLENLLLSSSEPNRCEYLFEFSTPALCSDPPHTHQHTEL